MDGGFVLKEGQKLWCISVDTSNKNNRTPGKIYTQLQDSSSDVVYTADNGNGVGVSSSFDEWELVNTTEDLHKELEKSLGIKGITRIGQ